MPRNPMDFTPIFPNIEEYRGAERIPIKEELPPEPDLPPAWKLVLVELRKRKEYHRLMGIIDTIGAFFFMALFVYTGVLFTLLLSALCAMLLVVRAVKCWINREIHPIYVTGRKLREIEDFLRAVGIRLPMPDGSYQVNIILESHSHAKGKGYIVHQAGSRRLR